jgi:hypothetical protein
MTDNEFAPLFDELVQQDCYHLRTVPFVPDVISFVADAAYMPHAKSFMVNCRRQGSYRGDFCHIAPADTDTTDFERRGINVFRVPDGRWSYLVKFWAFAPYFRRWRRALAIDLDVLVQGPLEPLFVTMGARLPKIQADLEDGTIIGGLRQWDPQRDQHEAVFQAIERRFPHVNQRMFNAAFLFYDPSTIPDGTIEQLQTLADEFKVINPAAADQMVLNLLLWPQMELAGKDWICFMGMDYPCNRIPSDFRRWRGDEAPAILHYTGGHAPWIFKRALSPAEQQQLIAIGCLPEMGGYMNHRLGRVCHELYAENLAAFEQEFPIL